MPSLDNWRADTSEGLEWVDDVANSVDAGLVIGEKSTSITVSRAGSNLDPQAVRLEHIYNLPRDSFADAGMPSNTDVVILGYKDHPTIDDTDLQVDDRFVVGGVIYRVTAIAPATEWHLEAYAEATR